MDIIFCKRALILITLNLTAEVSSRENRCYGNHCSEDHYGDMKAVCKNGFCYCTGKDYDYDSCLRKLEVVPHKQTGKGDSSFAVTPESKVAKSAFSSYAFSYVRACRHIEIEIDSNVSLYTTSWEKWAFRWCSMYSYKR
jgi:shikimate kinase